MPRTKSRIVGSGYTTFVYRGKPIAFLDTVQDTGQAPIGGAQAVIPLGAPHAVEIATSRIIDTGTLIVSIRELWNEQIWQQLAGLAGTETITDVWEALAQDPSVVTCQKIVKPPGSNAWRGLVYHNCVVTNIDDSELIANAQMTVSKNLTIVYTHKTPFTQPAA